MKKILLLVIVLFKIISPQNLLVPYDMEILPQTQNFDLESITFTIEPQNTVAYCISGSQWYVNGANSCDTTIIGNYLQPHLNPQNEWIDYGFDVCYSTSGYPKFWLTVNKITISKGETSFYFYIDYRDCGYGNNWNDITIRYDDNWGYFISAMLNTSIPSNGQSPTTCGFSTISLGQIFRIGLLNNFGTYNTDCMANLNYWANCLVLVNQNNHPALIWGPNPSFSATHFKIYRAESNGQVGNPINLNYSLIATVESNILHYTDFDVLISNEIESYYQYYYIKGFKNRQNTYSSPTNIVNVQGGVYKINSDREKSNEKVNFLTQNYPNPFNPITQIKYSLPEPTLVQLQVFDPFGKEVPILVNERKDEGTYEVEFDASNLSSGIYFYQLKTNNFIQQKRCWL
ncbi:MAG: T9SS type A sorting domain-containing protein [Ignavibacteriales bacterium]|nr:T9SS type A sorting domain-containing protein [Ignavibacteriales bacterium]